MSITIASRLLKIEREINIEREASQARVNALENALRAAEKALVPFAAYWELRKEIPPNTMCSVISLGSESRAITGADLEQARVALEQIRRAMQ